MMKKIISVFVVLALIFTSAVSFADEGREIKVFVDGEQIEFDVPPTSENGRTLVPMRYIFEALGAEVNWVQSENKAVAVKGDITVEIGVDNNVMTRNGKEIVLDVPAKATNGRILVPARAVAEAFDAKVDWLSEEYFVMIISAEKLAEAKKEHDAGYSWNTLSPNDTNKLINAFDEIRYTFEQGYLLNTLLPSSKEVVFMIDDNDDGFAEYVYDTWDYLMARVILDIQMNSEDDYQVEIDEDFGEAELINHYKTITENLKLSAKDMFKCSYVKTPEKNNVLLLTFKDTISRMTPGASIVPTIKSKYVAFAGKGETLRQFTLEQSNLDNDIYFFCEVMQDSRKNYGITECNEEAVLKGIDEVLK